VSTPISVKTRALKEHLNKMSLAQERLQRTCLKGAPL
jgi:hypothetical protein